MNTDVLSTLELRRYQRQIELPSMGIHGQEKIKQAKVLIAGAGGIGTTLLQHLVSSGVGTIGITDNTLVEENRLPNQRLFGHADLGKQKAILARQKLKELNNLVNIEVHNICLTASNTALIFSGYEIIVDATNNFSSHYLINDTTIKMNKPVVFGSVIKSQAKVSVFNYLGGPSFRCLYPEKPSDKSQISMEEVTSTGILTGLTGAIMANEVLKIILGFSNTLSGKLFVLNIHDYSTSIKKILKNPENFNR